jgi:hypothetical protein
MKKILVTLIISLISIYGYSQTNTCSGSFTFTNQSCTRITIGNGTPGCVRVCLNTALTSGGSCNPGGVCNPPFNGGGWPARVSIRNTGGGAEIGGFTTATATGTCITVTLNNGYADIIGICLTGGSITWSTVQCGTTTNACLPSHCSNGIQDANETGIDCGGSCNPCQTPPPPPVSGDGNTATTAILISSCNTSFTANSGSATASGCGTTFANLDCNTSTSHSGTAGNDVPWSIENDLWYVFCPTQTGSWSITVSATCYTNTGGYQLGIFQGSPTNLHTQLYASGCTQSSGINCTASLTTTTTVNFTVSTITSCIYIVLDGHAGNVCDFNVTLTTTNPECNILPISLLSFDAKKDKNNNVRLDWSTASEVNNDYFTIERSVDGENFTPIGTVKGFGNTNTTRNYSLLDKNPEVGINYYRLKQTDFDGRFEYFNIVAVKIESGERVNIFPNPTTGSVKVSMETSRGDDIHIKVFPIGGNVFFEKQITSNGEFITEEIHLSNKGMYLVEISVNGVVRREKIIRQ